MAVAPSTLTVAISSDFLKAFAKIPKQQQAKVRDFVEKFKANPASPGINYEKISSFKDQKLRSVKIDLAYRGIVLKPDIGNVYMLLWVDHHDEAYQWAENKVFDIHPETGGIQIVDIAAASVDAAAAPEAPVDDGLFAGVKDKHLTQFGVPKILLALVRSLRTEADLDQAVPHLPQEAVEALYMLAAGYSPEEVYAELTKAEVAQVDTTDYAAALANPDSQRRFVVVEDDQDLADILSAPLEQWRVFLHPSQRRLVEINANGPVRVLGGAGTGKTVVAMHRAKWLAESVFSGENDRILFTTFTKNLAADIRENLAKLCGRETMRRIEVVNLDAWVAQFLQKNGYGFRIAYDKQTRPLWQDALNQMPSELGLDETFYRDEWDEVIQGQGIATAAEYLKAPRIGRGRALTRAERLKVWPVFEEYRALLNEKGYKEPSDAMRDARALLEHKGDVLPYRAVIVDEAQDLPPEAFRLIRQLVPGGDQPHDLFIVGDAHQRIYRHKVVLGRCGINIRGRSRKLRINYRTTDETRKWAVSLLSGVSIDDLDGGLDDQKGYRSLLQGMAPRVKHFSTFKEEIDFLAEYLVPLAQEPDQLASTCLVARTQNLLTQYQGALKAAGIPTYQVRRSEADDRRAPGLRLATMHRVKGLEFDRVIIAGANDGVLPLAWEAKSMDEPELGSEGEIRERALLYVAGTRAKRELVVTSSGTQSPLLGAIPHSSSDVASEQSP
jgi:superfamily I DNA/RNA helicase/mRNA-degrading endonuclease RelE of RelBE toxin-antitoxin system